MKNNLFLIIASLVMLLTQSGCALVEGIFKAGVWVGVLLVVAVIGGVIFLISKMGGKK